MVNVGGLATKCYNVAVETKVKGEFPIKTGKLQRKASKLKQVNHNVWKIYFDARISPYVSFLEDGTDPFIMFNAFGRGIVCYNPGQSKWRHFIQDGVVNDCLKTIRDELSKVYGRENVFIRKVK